MKVLAEGPEGRIDRPASAVLHDESNVRVVCFHLLEGQSVPPHHSDATVIVEVLSGTGVFRGEDSEATLPAGAAAVFAPGELHAIDARSGPLRFHAVIAPRPGG